MQKYFCSVENITVKNNVGTHDNGDTQNVRRKCTKLTIEYTELTTNSYRTNTGLIQNTYIKLFVGIRIWWNQWFN